MSTVSESIQARGAGRGPKWAEPVGAREEKRLIQACQGEDAAAFERLVGVFQNQVFGLAYHLLRDHDEAQDVAQEVFLSCYRKLGTFRFESRLSTWLYRVTVNRVKNRWKYHQRRQRDKHDSIDEPRSEDNPGPVEVADPSPDPRRRAQGRQMVEILEARLADLSPEFRQVMALRFGQELSYDEMAEVLGCSVGTVKSRINRARRQLRQSMRDVL